MTRCGNSTVSPASQMWCHLVFSFRQISGRVKTMGFYIGLTTDVWMDVAEDDGMDVAIF